MKIKNDLEHFKSENCWTFHQEIDFWRENMLRECNKKKKQIVQK